MSESTEDMLDDEAEEKRARWIFNLVVFFLVYAFAVDLSYMTGSLIPIGVGLSLIAWRVWRTPEITDPISSHVSERTGQFLCNLGITLGAAPILVGVSAHATRIPYTGSEGFPFSVKYVVPGCFGPGGPLGCLAYDPLGIVLDYLFWGGLSFVVLTVAGWVRTRRA